MEHVKIKFKIYDNPIQFNIRHNLKEFGLNINTGLGSWLIRTDEYTKKSFVEYLKSKTPTAIIY